MKILCAWCCREGRPAYLGEREPLDNPATTHGVCADHKAQLLESLPSRSFPDTQVLIVVHRSNMALYERLKLSLAAMSHVDVIVDRRRVDRRTAPGRISGERRHVRTRRIREGTISPLGDFTIVRFTPKAPLSAALLELEQRTASL
jgi:hypothetical protein